MRKERGKEERKEKSDEKREGERERETSGGETRGDRSRVHWALKEPARWGQDFFAFFFLLIRQDSSCSRLSGQWEGAAFSDLGRWVAPRRWAARVGGGRRSDPKP